MTEAEYFALPAVNFSLLKHMRRSPLAFKHALTTERLDCDAFRLGRATHCAVLEPDQFPLRYMVWDEGPRRGKEWIAFESLAEQLGKTVLTLAQYENALAIRDAVRVHPLAAPLLVGGQAEHVLQWRDEKTGLDLKAKLDMLSPAGVIDLKTSRHATNPRLFASTAWELGYPHQLEFYRRGTGEETPCYVIAVEPFAPFDVTVFQLDEDTLWLAGEELDKLLTKLKECRETDSWPGANPTTQMLSAPRWAHANIEDMGPVADPSWMTEEG